MSEHTHVTRNVVLVVLDGVGISDSKAGNALAQAETPTLDELFDRDPYTELAASGPAVGLPDGYMGNSEVGHLHIGAGRIVPQYLTRINEAIEDRTLFDRSALQNTVAHVQETGGTVHLLGLVSDGGVHAHIEHLHALIRWFGEQDVDIITHAILDGRDVLPESAEQYITQIEETADTVGTGHIGSLMGRFYAMDRDQNWDRTKTAYELLVSGDGRTAQSVSVGIHMARDRDRNDYFVPPTIIEEWYAPIQDGDVLICTNFRNDRMRQLWSAFTDPNFDRFEAQHPDSVRFVSLTPYGKEITAPAIMEGITVQQTLGEAISDAGLQQLRITESQKAPHITYFFNGQRETVFPGEDRTIIQSADVTAYDEKPEMEAVSLTDHAIKAMDQNIHDFILINYPNGDLVGHTGNMDATVEALETVDTCIQRLVDAAFSTGYTVVLTADHGNCEQLRQNGEVYTAHTLNTVPFCIVEDAEMDNGEGVSLQQDECGLSRVAATVLGLLNVDIPEEMEASLLDE